MSTLVNDPSYLLGIWTNADRNSICLRQIQVTSNHGALKVQLYPALGAKDSMPDCVGEGYLARPGGTTFQAITALAPGIRLEGNMNAGLLVLCCYKSTRDGPYSGLFSREYFFGGAALDQNKAQNNGLADPLFHGLSVPAEQPTGHLHGFWKNADQTSGTVDNLRITETESGFDVSAHAREGPDWGRVAARLFTDVVYGAVGGIAASAVFNLGDTVIDMQIRETKGVLVIVNHMRFSDGSPAQYNREFFFRP